MSNEDYNPKSIDSKLTSIEAKVDMLVERRLDHEARLVSMAERITKLEQFRWYLAGAVAALVALAKYLKLF